MKTKRNLLKLLSLTLAVLMLASCASSTVNPDTETAGTENTVDTVSSAEESATETEEETVYISDDLPDEDFNGYSFRILSCIFYSKELATYLTYDELTGVPVDDALYNSKLYIEDRFNTGVSWIASGLSEIAGTAKTAINAGDDAFDMAIGPDTSTISLGKSGLVRNLLDVEEFNFDKPWWPKNAVESWTISGFLCAASNYMSYCGIHWTRAITVNKDWAEELQMEIPYEAVREGKWTLDMLNQLTDDVTYDVDGNGKITQKDKVGFASGGQTWYCLQESVDLPIYRKDENGDIYLDLDVERTDSFLEIMRKLTSSDKYLSVGDFAVDIFKTGNALFAYTQVGDAYDYYRISDVRYGFLPTPKLDESQENYINCCTDVPWIIPKTVAGDQQHIVGTICEAMSCYNYNNVLPIYLEGALKSRASDSENDTEMLQLIADTRTIGFAYAYQLNMNNILSALLTNGQGAASYFKSNEKSSTKIVQKLAEKFADME